MPHYRTMFDASEHIGAWDSRRLPMPVSPRPISERDTRPHEACPATQAELADDRDTAVGRRFGVMASRIHGDRLGSTLRLGGAL